MILCSFIYLFNFNFHYFLFSSIQTIFLKHTIKAVYYYCYQILETKEKVCLFESFNKLTTQIPLVKYSLK